MIGGPMRSADSCSMTVPRPGTLVLPVILIFAWGCGEKAKDVGTNGGPCDANGMCENSGLDCNNDGICVPTIRQPKVTVNITSASLLAPAGITACAEQSTVAPGLDVAASIRTGDSCEFTVNPDTLTTSGSCADVETGSVEPFVVIYSVEDPVSYEHAALAYLVASVDLTTQSIGSGASVSIDLLADGVASVQLNTNAEMVGLCAVGTSGCNDVAALARNLCFAECTLAGGWVLGGSNPPFDRDSDGTSNLQEACDGTLFN